MTKNDRDIRKRRRRRRARIIAFIGYSAAVIGLAWFFEQQATTTVIFVRHADVDAPLSGAGPDQPLNAAGLARAEMLAAYLAEVDVTGSVNAIYASPALRTQQTAAPLARRLGLEVEIDDPFETERFAREILRDHKGEIVLIVTHRDAIAPLIDELHGKKNFPPIEPDEFDNVYIVTIPWFGKVKTLLFSYGVPYLGPRSISELSPPAGAGSPAAQP